MITVLCPLIIFLARQKGTSAMWHPGADAMSPLRPPPPGSVTIFTLSVEPTQWDSRGGDQELSLVSGAICFQREGPVIRSSGPGIRAHSHTAPYVWLCNRVIIVLVKWVIDRWRCCSEWQLHPQSEIKTMVSPPHGEEHADATLYYNVAATMSKPLPGLTDPIPLRVLMK